MPTLMRCSSSVFKLAVKAMAESDVNALGECADFIWTDDDIRTQWHEVSDSCYCQGCIALFNEKTGGSYDREGLVEELEKNKELSLRWDGFRSDLIKHLLVTVNEYVQTLRSYVFWVSI